MDASEKERYTNFVCNSRFFCLHSCTSLGRKQIQSIASPNLSANVVPLTIVY